LGALQNLMYVASCAPKQVGLARAIGHQPPGAHVLAQLIHCRQPVLRHEVNDPCDTDLVEGFAGHRERIGALLHHCCECGLELDARAHAYGDDVTPNVGAAACISSSWRTLEALSGLKRKATRETVGITSLRICSRLAPTSGPRMVLPVIFPPGRARLGTSPARTGSPIEIMTMGTVVVACLAAKLAGVPKVAITSTGRRTSAAAASASRSGAPSPYA